MADQSEVDRILSQYGQGYTSPALNSGDGEIASTPDILAQYGANERMASGIPGFLRRIGAGLRSLAPSQVTTPVNTLTGLEPPLSAREDHANPLMLMGGEGADTMASWIDMHPGVDRGQSRPQDLLAPLGLSAMAPLTAVNNAAGIFGGRLARTADREALSRAEEMAGRGVPRNEIWDQTGWFQGPDKQWRFEINDKDAHFRQPVSFDDLNAHRPIQDVMEHPALFEAYPDMNPRLVEPQRGTGGAHGVFRGGDTNELGVLGVLPRSAYNNNRHYNGAVGYQRSVGLHELQHAVQEREGFARGASPDEFVYQNSPLFRERRSYESPHDAYRRAAGEVEARNVQMRRDFSEPAREAVPPWRTQDVPDADQILRQYGQGPQMSAPDTKGPRGFQPVEFTPEMREAARQGYLANEPESIIADRVGVAIGTLRKHMPSIREEFGIPVRQRVGSYGLPPTLDEIRAAYNNGATTPEALGAALGRTPSTAQTYLREAGLTHPIPPRNADVMSQVETLRRDGMSYGDIGRTLGLTRNKVAGIVRDLRAQGVAVPAFLTSGVLLGEALRGDE